MLHIPAAVVEKERNRIAQRTREALAAAKARGQQLGANGVGERSRVAADVRAERLRAIVTPLAGQTSREIAKALNDQHVPTARGGYWHAQIVMRLMARLGLPVDDSWTS
jgi:DNA invertase Pin-like site-specific DNA recombinase